MAARLDSEDAVRLIRALDDDLAVGIHPRQDPRLRILQVDLDAERPALDVQRPGRPRDAARDLLVAERPDHQANVRALGVAQEGCRPTAPD